MEDQLLGIVKEQGVVNIINEYISGETNKKRIINEIENRDTDIKYYYSKDISNDSARCEERLACFNHTDFVWTCVTNFGGFYRQNAKISIGWDKNALRVMERVFIHTGNFRIHDV
jgi:hypothetical protein